jgi:hypothetical protein
VWLKADLDLLWARVRHKDTRPLLRTPDPYGTLKALYEARVPSYALAELQVEARPEYSIDEMAAKVIAGAAHAPRRSGDQAEMTDTVRVELGARAYDVRIGPGLIARAGAEIAPLLGGPASRS